jgi:hypothetical protein
VFVGLVDAGTAAVLVVREKAVGRDGTRTPQPNEHADDPVEGTPLQAERVTVAGKAPSRDRVRSTVG